MPPAGGVSDWTELIKNAGLAGALLVVVLGGLRQWYVWGWLYREVVKDRDEWKVMALKGINVADRAVNVAETSTRPGT